MAKIAGDTQVVACIENIFKCTGRNGVCIGYGNLVGIQSHDVIVDFTMSFVLIDFKIFQLECLAPAIDS